MVVVVQGEVIQGCREQEREKQFIWCDHIQELYFKMFSLGGTRPGQLMSHVSFTDVNVNVTQHFNDFYVE